MVQQEQNNTIHPNIHGHKAVTCQSTISALRPREYIS